MGADLIVSYDGTANDEDGLALGGLLAATGAKLALAYVRHSQEWDDHRERIAQHDAETLLARGALALDDPDVDRHVVVDASTPAGLRELAEREGAALLVFGSEYRTSPGRAEPGTSAQSLLDGGAMAVAVAAAGLRAQRRPALETLALATDREDGAAEQTLSWLAERLGARRVASGSDADLVVVGSQPGGPPGRIRLAGEARSVLNSVRGSVLVVPVGVTLRL